MREFTDVLRRREAYADSSSSMSFAMDRRTRELGPGIYQDFIRPVEDDLASATKLYVVLPDGVPTLPFHALRRTALPGSEYLAERFQLSYLPSAKTLTLPRPVLTGVHDVAGIGFPGSTGWDVEYELRDIRAFFKEAKLYFNQRATLTTLQAEHADVLHLAIECRFHHQDPQNLAVVLSDGKSPDASALVPVAALFSLRGSPTIVLSALESERTAIHPSLPYIFLADGSGYVIMNTYLPSRKVKKSFGESFYTALMDGNTTPPVAFRTAQRDMIKNPETSAPGVWAPFFAWGY